MSSLRGGRPCRQLLDLLPTVFLLQQGQQTDREIPLCTALVNLQEAVPSYRLFRTSRIGFATLGLFTVANLGCQISVPIYDAHFWHILILH